MEKSSMNTSLLSSISSRNMAVIQCWKVAGGLHNPNGIRLYAKVPYAQTFELLVDKWEWKVIFLSHVIKLMIVDAHAPSGDRPLWNELVLLILHYGHSFFLWDNLDRTGPRTVRDGDLHHLLLLPIFRRDQLCQPIILGQALRYNRRSADNRQLVLWQGRTLADPDGIFDGSINQLNTHSGSIRHGSMKLPRSHSFRGKILWMIAEHSSLSLTEEAAFSSFSLCERRWREAAHLYHPFSTSLLGRGKTDSMTWTVNREFVLRYVIVKDLYQEPILYSMMGDLLDKVLETDPSAFDGFVNPLFELEDPVSKGRGASYWKKIIKKSRYELIPCRDLGGGVLSSHSATFPLREK
ncbi:hypothetical protein Tco_1042230 [Tanacetum coccineum]|uniref:Uncharacterized protein n=1 Tax=Tanacetum coccineum TaxID=301880 RepID=A0ABQ5GJ32_9ASTR